MASAKKRYGPIKENFSVRALVEAEGGGAPKPPTETQKLQKAQKQQEILSKQRNATELAAAERRDLDAKSREQMQKITQPKTTK